MSEVISNQQLWDKAHAAFERWHAGQPFDTSERSNSWRSGYVSALKDALNESTSLTSNQSSDWWHQREPYNIIMRYKAERSTIEEAIAEIRKYGEECAKRSTVETEDDPPPSEWLLFQTGPWNQNRYVICRGTEKVEGDHIADFTYREDAELFLKAKQSAQETSGWRSIDTAPRDGTQILTYRDAEISPQAVAFWSVSEGIAGWAMSCGPRLLQVTHWKPLDSGPHALKASTNDVLHCAKHWNELPENGTVKP